MQASSATVEVLTSDDAADVAALSLLSGDTGIDVRAEASKPHSLIWVARDHPAGPPVAYALGWLVADEMQIVDLATAPAHRRRGHARRLLQSVCARARAQGCKLVLLEVRANNVAAVALYRGVGFELARQRQGYYRDGEDALEMLLCLESAAPDSRPADASQ